MNAAHHASDWHIRRAIPGDADAICALHVHSIRTLCAKDYAPGQIEAWAGSKRAKHYTDAMSRGELLFVAEMPDQLIGFASLVRDEIQGLYLHPEFLRRGLGSAMLAAMESEFLNQGVAKIKLFSTLTAEAFYLKKGFQALPRTTVRMNGADLPCIPMHKQLKQAYS